ncbi:MAG: VWA domain-containing protein [Lentisphaeraceae bacterium]|nr:VWA domain-containing protein [Lentisphaeraceae bacterium]
MTDLQFTGDMGPVQGIIFALIVSTAAWFLYFRQVRHRQGMAKVVLPSLRSGAIFLLIMMLTQPILHHEKLIGELGKLFVVIDNSESMKSTDADLELYRKVMIVKSLGQDIDVSEDEILPLIKLQQDKTSIQSLLTNKADYGKLKEQKDSFIENFTTTKELVGTKDQKKNKLWGDQLKLCNSAKDAPQLQGALQGLINSSTELIGLYGTQLNKKLEKFSDLPIIQKFNRSSRWQRIERVLLESNQPLIDELAKDHEVELLALKGNELESIWKSKRLGDEDTTEDDFNLTLPAAPLTDIDQALQLEVGAQKTAIVLLSDGQHNHGNSPLQQSKILANRNVKIYTVGYGGHQEPQDLSIQNLQAPETVYFKNDVHGSIHFNDHMKSGEKFTVKLTHNKETIWEKELTTDGSGSRKIDFQFPLEKTIEKELGRSSNGLEFKNLPVQLKASLSHIVGDRQRANNSKLFTVTAAIQKRQLLLIDHRARWEWRYLKTMFERNEKWQVNAVRPEQKASGEAFKRGRENGSFPIDKKALFNYDLIIFGDIQSRLFSNEEMTWLREFVELRGGGLVFIDGRRNGLLTYGETPLKSLIPVKWKNNNGIRNLKELKLTTAGNKHVALNLSSKDKKNTQVWSSLSKIHWTADTEALPGTETLINNCAETPQPVLVSRHFGGGKILYSATEDFWRWRYKKGDIHHNRFWQQLADSMMEKAYSVQDNNVAIDTGKTVYQKGEKADIRVRLRDNDGRLMNNTEATAVLSQGDKIVAKLPLKESSAGMYSARSHELLSGNYTVQVKVKSLSSLMSKAKASFSVEAPSSQELSQLTVNDKLLKEIAHNSSGKYYPEEQIQELKTELKTLSSGKLIQIDTALWQSYWYFALVIALFTIEWIYRKRIGLL